MSSYNISHDNGSLSGNSTQFLEEIVSTWLWRVIAPVLLVVGLTGNTLVLLVLKSMQFRKKPTLLYFFVLAISDTAVLIVGLLHYWLMETFDINVRVFSDPGCKILMFFIYFAMHMSSWTLVAVSVERFVMVKLPLHSSSLITVRRARYSILGIALFLFAVDGYLLGTQHVFNGSCGSREEDGFLYFFDEEIFVWIDFSILSVIPATIMTTCNILIARALRRSMRRHKMMTRPSENENEISRVRVSSLTRMLLAVNVVFLITTFPISVYFILDTFLKAAENKDEHTQARMDLTWSVVYLIQYTNYTTNFYLYVARGKRFRKAFWVMIGRSRSLSVFMSSERGMSARVMEMRNQVNGTALTQSSM